MPIQIEQICVLNQSDEEDLLKIYADYPTPSSDDTKQWLQHLATNQQLWAGRFNDRLLVAAQVDSGSTEWQLNHLCVRAITRRRGTASQFLSLLYQAASKQKATLSVRTNNEDDGMTALLKKNGFEEQAKLLWQK